MRREDWRPKTGELSPFTHLISALRPLGFAQRAESQNRRRGLARLAAAAARGWLALRYRVLSRRYDRRR